MERASPFDVATCQNDWFAFWGLLYSFTTNKKKITIFFAAIKFEYLFFYSLDFKIVYYFLTITVFFNKGFISKSI